MITFHASCAPIQAWGKAIRRREPPAVSGAVAPRAGRGGEFFVAGVDHRTAPVQWRERVAVPADALATRAEAVQGEAVSWTRRRTVLAVSDIVVGAAGCPEHVLRREDLAVLQKARRNRPFFLIDIAVPRIFDPGLARLDGVYLYDIDDLSRLVAENREQREAAVAGARVLIEQAVVEGKRRLRPGNTINNQEGQGRNRPPQEFGGARTGWPRSSTASPAVPAGAL